MRDFLEYDELSRQVTPSRITHFWRSRWDSNPRTGFHRLRDFQSRSFDHSDTTPLF